LCWLMEVLLLMHGEPLWWNFIVLQLDRVRL